MLAKYPEYHVRQFLTAFSIPSTFRFHLPLRSGREGDQPQTHNSSSMSKISSCEPK